MPKIESENKFLTSIKGHNFILICQNLPICNPKTLLPDINSYTKFQENWLKMHPAESENEAVTDGKTDRRTDVPTFIFFLSILHVKKVSNNAKRTQQYSRLLRIKSYFQRL